MRADKVGLPLHERSCKSERVARKGYPSFALARTILPLLAVVIGVTPDGSNWVIRYTQNYLNVGIATMQSCTIKDKLVWFDAPYINIESDSSSVEFHRETKGIPVGAACKARFQIRRNDSGGSGDDRSDYDATGEVAEINWVQK